MNYTSTLLIIIFFIVSTVSPSPLIADTVTLKSGKTLKGDIDSVTDTHIEIDTESMGLIKIKRRFVKEFSSQLDGVLDGGRFDHPVGAFLTTAEPKATTRQLVICPT